MKNRRAMLWLVLALAAVIGAHVLLTFKGGTGAALVQRSTLLDGKFAAADRISLERRGKRTISIVRDGDWRMVEPYQAEVDERTVLKLIDALAFTEIDDSMTDGELLRLGHSRADYSLGDEALKLTATADGQTATIFLGSRSHSGVYAAVEGEDAVYLMPTNLLDVVDLPPEGFRQRSLFPLRAGDVAALDIKNGAGSFLRFVREGETWLMREPTSANANAAAIRKLLDGISSAEALEFLWPLGAKGESSIPTASLLAGYGLDPDTAVTITLKCQDGTDRQFSFGKAAKDGLVYALVQNASAIVTVDGSLRDLAAAGVAGFTDSRIFTMERGALSRLSLTDGDANYLLSRADDGTWTLDAPLAAPADAESVNALLDRLFALESGDVASEGVTISVSTSSVPVTVARAAFGGLRLQDLRSREIMRIAPANVKRIVVTRRAAKPDAVVYDRDRRTWGVEQSANVGSADVSAIDDILRAINPLSAKRIVALKVTAAEMRKFGLEEPRLTVAIDQDREDAVRRNLLIGDDAPGGGAYATLGAADAVFVVDGDAVKIFENRLVK